jgi:acyl carrier protein
MSGSKELLERMGRALRAAGLPEVPENVHEDLSLHGMDSLLMVLSVAELEKEFGIRIPAHAFSEESFQTLEALAGFLRSLGAE